MLTSMKRLGKPATRLLSSCVFLAFHFGCGSDSGDASDAAGTSGTAATSGGAGGATTSGGTGGVAASAGGGGSSGGSGGSSTMGGAGGSGGSTAGGAGGSGGTSGAGGGAMGGAGGSGGSGGGASGEFELTSPVLDSGADCSPDVRDNCAVFPLENTGMGDNESPELNWTPGPEGTQSYAIILHDLVFMQQPDVPFAHWAIWNIPATTTSLPAMLERSALPSMPAGAQQVSLSNDNGYAGPGACNNVYEFILFALGTAEFTPSNEDSQAAVRDDLLDSDDVLDMAVLRAQSAEPNCD